MKIRNSDASEHEAACERVAARFKPRWLRGYVASKLRSDPVYPAAYGLIRESNEPVLDVGCGVGLLAFYLRERNVPLAITGIDSDARKIQQATTAAKDEDAGIHFDEGDVRRSFAFSGNVVLFDILHYLKPDDQLTLLRHLAGCVAPGGMLLIRDCPRDHSARFWLTGLAEKFAQMISWNLSAPLYFPSRESINAAFDESAFSSTIEPLWGRTPFNNHLFVFRKVSA